VRAACSGRGGERSGAADGQRRRLSGAAGGGGGLRAAGSMSKLWASLRRLVSSRELAGTDAAGNRYYRWTEKVHGESVERRQVDVRGANYLYDPKNLPGPWRMWLSKTRDAPPSEEELRQCVPPARPPGPAPPRQPAATLACRRQPATALAASPKFTLRTEEKSALMRRRVAALDEAERLRKFKSASLGGAGGAQPTAEHWQRQIGRSAEDGGGGGAAEHATKSTTAA